MSPREQVRKVINERGGVVAVAESAGMDFTRLYGWLKGGSLMPDNAGKLRAALPEVPAEVWLEAFAPAPEPATDAST